MRRLIFVLVGSFLCLSIFFPYSTRAHANLVESTPAANDVIAQAPATARLRFSEPLEASYSRVVLLNVERGPVSTAQSRVAPDDSYVLLLDLPALPEGQYVLQWRTLSSADGHTLEGVVPFAIGDPAAANAPLLLPPPPPDPQALPPALDVASRWLTVLGLSLVVGSAIFGWLVWQPIAAGDAVSERLRAMLRWLEIGAALLALLGTIGMLALAASRTGLGVMDLIGGSRVGLILALRLGLVLALVVALWPELRSRRALTLALGCAALLTISLLSHSAAPRTQDNPAVSSIFTGLAIAFDFVHLLATAAWVGALPALLLGLLLMRRSDQDTQRASPTLLVARFTALATAAVIVLAATGSYAALQQIGQVRELWTTTYGLALTIKLGLFLLLLLLGGYNRWRVAPVVDDAERGLPAGLAHLRRSVRIEIGAGVALLLAVGVLTSATPARDVLSQAPGYIASAAIDEAAVTLQVVRGNVAGDIYAVDVRDLPAGVQPEVFVRASMPAHGMGEQEIQLREVEPGRWGGRAALLTMQGAWSVETIVRASGMNDLRHTFTVDTTTLKRDSAPSAGPALWAVLLVIALMAAALSQLPLHRRWQGRLQMSSLALIGGAFIATTLPYYFARATATENPLSATPEVLAAGRQIYQQNCVSCHGETGRGDGPAARSLPGLPADFTQQHFVTHTDAEIFGWIKSGKPGTVMPAFGEDLSDEQIWQVVTHIRELSKGGQQ
ncbi:MAG TPA: CopD family protein [Herpetosiphonaceae bacterium]